MPLPTGLLGAIQEVFANTNLIVQIPGNIWTGLAPDQTTMPFVVIPSLRLTNDPGYEGCVADTGDVEFVCVAVGAVAAEAIAMIIKNTYGPKASWETMRIQDQIVEEFSYLGYTVELTKEYLNEAGNPVYKGTVTFHAVVNSTV